MMEDRVWVGFMVASDAFVFVQHGLEPLSELSVLPAKRSEATVLLVIEHWHFGATPLTPEHLHEFKLSAAKFQTLPP